ncbi:Asd/ArgC dimerization domain-containing protein [Candidatus Avelusimicrobium facis]|uniref:aspartate-semialdehyde dehydrogenase n=1 Tax=Candidatus Avelusimicrobium facis TaxID=3416203 RepID=UPI0015B555AC
MKTVGIIGANGVVGRTLQQEFKKITASFDTRLFGRQDEIPALDAAVLCTDNPDSVKLYRQIKDRVRYIVDMSSQYRLEKGVPLVIPEINPQTITPATQLIASPNCTTTGLVMTLAPLMKHYHLTETFFCSYQAISGGGKKLLEDFHTPGSLYENNCVPLIGSVQESGYTSEELKGIYETRKILDLPQMKVYPHTVRVAVENSHSLGITVKAQEAFDVAQVKQLWNAFPHLQYREEIITPKEASGQETTYACRLRRDLEEPNIIHYFVTFDNLLKGAAMNARQIIELLLEKYL